MPVIKINNEPPKPITLEDISQEDDINDVFPIEIRIAIKSIIQKLGGKYFGNLGRGV